jgi:Cysteine-rich secretory protein family
MQKLKRGRAKMTAKKEYEILGGLSATIGSLLIISIFLGTSLDVVLIRSQQYAAVVSAALVDMANGSRVENGVGGLTLNPVLQKVAQLKANDMAAKGYFAHVAPDGTDPWHWFSEAGYAFSYAGENLALDFSDSRDVSNAWMNSPTHRANILDKNFTEVGIATAQGMYQGRPTTFVVQAFGAPAKSAQVAAVQESVPTDSTELAAAVPADNVPQVLGESTAAQTAAAAPAVPATQAPPQYLESPIKDDPRISQIAIPLPQSTTLVMYAAASPRTTSHYLYFGAAFMLLISLAIATSFEFHAKHKRKALATGALFALILLLFVLGERTLFTKPTVTPVAAVAQAL